MKISIDKRSAKNADAYQKAVEQGDEFADLKLKGKEAEEISQITEGKSRSIVKR